MPISIIHASIDENGKASGGRPGDQTGREVCVRTWYSKPWDYYIECTDRGLADKAASIFREVARSNKCGYDQGDRLSFYRELSACNGDIAKMRQCETDCSAAVAAIYRFLGINISESCTTRNIRKALLATGKFRAYSDPAHTSSDRLAMRGGLYLKEGSHVVMAGDDGPGYAGASHTHTATDTYIENLIRLGQQHSIRFTGVTIRVDGRAGSETRKMKHLILQHAMNLDYGAGLAEDGNVGPASRKALGSHYVRKGNRQHMVTAAEILMYLNGTNPNGVEYPGHYGKGLTEAAKQRFGGDGGRIGAAEFLKLIE